MSSLLSTWVRTARTARLRAARVKVVALLFLVLSLWLASLLVGDTVYSLTDVALVLGGHEVPGATFAVGDIRLPRASMALLAGLAFGAAGVTFQTLLHNQLASPDIIGISSGASAAGVIGIVVLGWSQTPVTLLSLCAALCTAALIYALSIRDGFAGTRLILMGIGVSSMLGSVVTYVLSQASAWDLQTATRWLTGSLNGATWERTGPLAVGCSLALPALLASSHSLAALRFGDDAAVALGVSVQRTRLLVVVCAVSLIAVATASCGPIAFVAFMAGPIAVRLMGPTAPLMPSAALVGAALVLVSDLCGQYAFGARYPVGIITGVMGAPYLIHLLVRSHRSGRY